MRKITKLFNTKAQSINDETKTIRFKISDDQTDRMGEVVDQASWDFKNYLNNPIVLWGHNPDQPENVLGQTLSLDTVGGETFAEMQFDDDINPKASLVWKQLLKGTLRTVSVGFISNDTDGNVLKNNELLEVSVVPIPANPRAISLSMKEGSLSRKDSLYLQESMRKEMDFLAAELKATEPEEMETKDVNEVKDQIAQLTELIGQLGQQVGEIKTEVATLSEAAKAEEETDTTDESSEDDETAQSGSDEATDTKDDDDDSANDGDNDQSGADEDEIDLEAELTPEQEAEIEAELAQV